MWSCPSVLAYMLEHFVFLRDSYWIIRGLLLCEMYDTARGMIENLATLVDQ